MKPTLPGSTDVVVVGGGIMGTSAAYFLATETDLDVTLVEKDAVAAGSTGDSSAILRHHYGDQAIYSRLALWSHRFYRDFEAETGAPLAREENALVRFAVDGTPGADYVEAGYEVLESLGVPVTRHERETLDDEFPMLDCSGFDFGVSDDAAAYSDGTDAASGFARAAREAGASVVTGVAVEDVLVEDDAIAGVETADGTVACDAVVLAAGPWTPRLAETVGVDVPIRTSREQIVILDPPAGYTERYPDLTPTTALSGGEWYVRPDFGGGVLVATHHTGEAVDPDRYDPTPDEERLLELTDRLAETIPELADAGIRGQYCGVYSNTPDHDFVIDEAGPEGCYLACGFSGHGFKNAPGVGWLVADMVADDTLDREGPDVDSEFFSLARFDGTPEGHGLPDDLA